MRRTEIKSRTVSFLIILVIYIAAAAAGFLVYYFTSGMPLLISTLLADIAATIVVWLFGIFLKNSSVYDPYWSVAPVFIIIFWIVALDISINATHILFMIAIFAWGIRWLL